MGKEGNTKVLKLILIGRTVKEAKGLIPYSIREVKIDKKDLIITMEFRSGRINVATENGLITEVFDEG